MSQPLDVSSGKSKRLSLWTQGLPMFQQHSQTTVTGRRRANSRNKNPEELSSLQRSFSTREGLEQLKTRKWRRSDIQYLVLLFILLFSFAITPPAPVLKLSALIAGGWILLMPATRQFFLPSLPIWTWLVYFFCSRFIPYEYRPHIWVRILPALENVLYGANLSNILSAHKHPILDILAWLPYGIMHFGAPVVCSLIMFIFGAPGTTPIFASTFGWMNLAGVTIQLMFPCTPPWYENANGLVPAKYGMPGSPAGLARVDEIFGIDLYTTNFTNAPLPFGAFPSLHAANAVLEALFMSHCFPQFRTFFVVYAGWVWWATMYLSHHYAIDLVGGGLIAAAFFYSARARWLPRRQEDKLTRWDYDYVEVGQANELPDEEAGKAFGTSMFRLRNGSIDSSTLCSGDGWSEGSGTLSPITSDGSGPSSTAGFGPERWEGANTPKEIELRDIFGLR